ncbi:hypothetical protein [Bacillus nitroreducens]
MRRLLEAIKANYDFFVDVYERTSSTRYSQEQPQYEEKKRKVSRSNVIPFVPREQFVRNKHKKHIQIEYTKRKKF